MSLSRNTRGALLMMAAMAGFSGNDALIKAVTPVMNVGQIMCVRGIVTTVLVFFIARHLGALRPWRVLLQPMILLRVLFEILAAITYLTAIAAIPLANAAAILQALPLVVTLGAAVFLGEPVGWRRWTAIAVGFVGVLIIIRPGAEGFGLASASVVLCTFFTAARDLATRQVRSEVPSLMVTLATAVTGCVAGALLTQPMGGWRPMSAESFAILLSASVLVLVGYQCIIIAMRTGEISFIAPFRYFALLWAIVLGMIFFGDMPDLPMLAGIAIVIASGLYTFHRERKRQDEATAETVSMEKPALTASSTASEKP